ncbi:hypothetical protein QQO50_00005, partial [Clostridioides difficile]|nr:hypothetical protein [Clostridioides difficile]
KKKLCRSSSIVTFIVSIMLFIMAFLGYRIESGQMDEKKMVPFSIIFIIVILSYVLVYTVDELKYDNLFNKV